jgi:hypothetical protein
MTGSVGIRIKAEGKNKEGKKETSLATKTELYCFVLYIRWLVRRHLYNRYESHECTGICACKVVP